MKKIALHWQILIALVLAVLAGYFLPVSVPYFYWIGELFLNALKMIVIPLIFSSIVSGITSMGGGRSFGRLGLKTISYYMVTSLFAILTGLVLVNLIQPGVGADLGLSRSVDGLKLEGLSFKEIILGIVPSNVFQAMAEGQVLPVIFFAMLLGYFISRIGEQSKKTLTRFFDAFFDVMMKITMFIIKFTPLGIFAIVAHEVSNNSENLLQVAGSMGMYMVVVVAGLLIHATITLPLLTRLAGRANPLKHFKNMLTPLLTAFSTSSSSATLPLTMDAVENNSGVPNKISSFTLPLGATINMDGTALYECVAAMFIAQVYGIDIGFGQQMIVVITALLASIGAAGIPMAGLVMITIILSAVNLPLEGIGLILAVDRILDMLRTSVNVWSDSCGSVIIAKTEGEELKV
ncbi:MAG: dicarboxylate/amino acid:cation symporter [Prolixibacteraceae bacterium]|nr:dicarboxylate/amino acid:cation symporter [Prolixibacteraceae bacterium]